MDPGVYRAGSDHPHPEGDIPSFTVIAPAPASQLTNKQYSVHGMLLDYGQYRDLLLSACSTYDEPFTPTRPRSERAIHVVDAVYEEPEPEPDNAEYEI